MNIAIGSDQRGLNLKQTVINILMEKAHACNDFGAHSVESVDYPDIAKPVAEAVSKGLFDYGILICGTGIGMSIAANKVKGVRAALCCDVFGAMRARLHNDANILCLGAERDQPVSEILDAFLNTTFEGGRHARRLDKIKAIEDGD